MAARGLGGGGRRLKAHPDQAAQQVRVIGVGGDLRLDSLDLVAEVSVAAVAAADAEQHQTAAKQEREHEMWPGSPAASSSPGDRRSLPPWTRSGAWRFTDSPIEMNRARIDPVSMTCQIPSARA